MAKEHFIVGKKDDGKHDGLYSNTKRLQEAEHQRKVYLRGDLDTPLAPTPAVVSPIQPQQITPLPKK